MSSPCSTGPAAHLTETSGAATRPVVARSDGRCGRPDDRAVVTQRTHLEPAGPGRLDDPRQGAERRTPRSRCRRAVAVVEQDRAARCEVLLDIAAYRPGVGAPAPVPPPRRPQHRREPEPLCGEVRRPGHDAVRRPVEVGLDPARVADRLGGAGDVEQRGPRPAQRQGAVVPAVDRDLVPGADEVAPHLGELLEHAAEDEEGGADVEPVQGPQERRGRGRVGAVVEGEGDVVGATDPGEGVEPARATYRCQRGRRRRQVEAQGAGGRQGDSRAPHARTAAAAPASRAQGKASGCSGAQTPPRASSNRRESSAGSCAQDAQPAAAIDRALVSPWPGSAR